MTLRATFLIVCQVFNFLKAKGSMSNGELDAAMGPVAKIGLGTCMKNKWVAIDKATKVRPFDSRKAVLGV